jgi:sigma-B regulation protein RsbU (phosphoserine phosphatase)
MAGFRHLSTRLFVWILGAAALTIIPIRWYQQGHTREIVLEQVSGRSAAVAAGIVEELQGVLRTVETSVHLTASRIDRTATDPAAIEAALQEMIATNTRIYGGAAAFEAFAAPDGGERFAPYFFRAGEALMRADLATAAYAYWKQPWYRQPVDERRAVWTEPYFDEGGGNILMVTRAEPLLHPDGRPAGVVTADVALAWLKRVAESNQPGRNGFVIVFSGSGRIITHPQVRRILKDSLESLAAETSRPELRKIQAEVAAGRHGGFTYASRMFDSRVHVDYRPVGIGGWGVIVGYDEDEFLEPVREVGRLSAWSAVVVFLALMLVIAVVCRQATVPLTELADTADELARGNFAAPIAPPRTRDEIGHLTRAFHRMRDELQRYVADLTTATAARQKLESELAIAQLIQRTMLPAPRHTVRAARPARIGARVVPAKAVGGDFYVYFPLGPERLVFAVGDVSDKGVPAALFMARTLTLLRTVGRELADPGEILARVNAELVPDNDECMFVTVFCGVLDLVSGELVCASAGHEAPLVLSATGEWAYWPVPSGPPLGLSDQVELPVSRRVLASGEVLLLYTDGVTDAADPAGRLLTTDGLIKLLRTLKPAQPELEDEVLQRVQGFAGGADQTDDITLFALRFD